MFSYIRGELAEVGLNRIVIDVGGIGYTVYVPGQAIEALPEPGREVKVHTYLHLREDAVVLYGFLSKDDLEIFKMLIGVSGIGPKGAVAILSALSADELRFAVLSGDAKAIAKAPGVGAKTAQRAILELKDKLSLEDALEKQLEHGSSSVPPSKNPVKNEAVMALTALGYSSSESLKAVSKVEITPETDVEEVLRQALKNMI